MTCVLIGERLTDHGKVHVRIFAYRGQRSGMPEARRTVVSNIHKDGTIPAEAGAHIADIIKRKFWR